MFPPGGPLRSRRKVCPELLMFRLPSYRSGSVGSLAGRCLDMRAASGLGVSLVRRDLMSAISVQRCGTYTTTTGRNSHGSIWIQTAAQGHKRPAPPGLDTGCLTRSRESDYGIARSVLQEKRQCRKVRGDLSKPAPDRAFDYERVGLGQEPRRRLRRRRRVCVHDGSRCTGNSVPRLRRAGSHRANEMRVSEVSAPEGSRRRVTAYRKEDLL